MLKERPRIRYRVIWTFPRPHNTPPRVLERLNRLLSLRTHADADDALVVARDGLAYALATGHGVEDATQTGIAAIRRAVWSHVYTIAT